jgi:hypothetical protein
LISSPLALGAFPASFDRAALVAGAAIPASSALRPGLSDHLHALGVVAANYNSLEGILYSLFSFYFRDQERAGMLFSQLKTTSDLIP